MKKHLSWSQIGCFNSCKKRYYWEYIENLKPLSFSQSLNFGTVFHKIMEEMYTTGLKSSCLAIAESEIAKIDTSRFQQSDFDKLDWNQSVLESIIDGVYAYFYEVDKEKGYSVVSTEGEYINPIKGSRLYNYKFISDLILCGPNGYKLVEYKTTSRLGDSYFERLKIDQQTRGMVNYLQKKHKVKIDKIEYRIIKKPGIKQTQKETREMFFDRLKSVFATSPDEYFISKEFFVNQDDVAEFEKEISMVVKEVNFVVKNKLYPKDTSKCSIMNCPFIPLCSKDFNAIELYERKGEKETIVLDEE